MASFDRAAEQTEALAVEIRDLLQGSPRGPTAAAIVDRMAGPLRVAVAGRVKAGKSTLLNALVGERLAPTDAGECTKIVTWYRRGDAYEVSAELRDGSRVVLPFDRENGSLEIDLQGRPDADIRSLSVAWPASTLSTMTLVDTPGLASLNAENSRRTIEFMSTEAEGPGEVDAVIYLMRHLHREDVAFLDAFMDRDVSASSAVNAIGVLSRADEIGAGRLDAIESAARIAKRYESDPNILRLVSAVVPVAGLVAETGLTLTEDEATDLRTLASVEPQTRERMLLSADTLAAPDASEVSVENRRRLLDRLGLFGVRFCVDAIASGAARTAADLGPLLVEASGLTQLRALIADQFGPRARVLKTRSAIAALRSLAREVEATHGPVATRIRSETERIEASASEFVRIRTAHLVSSGAVELADGEESELTRLLLGASASAALGVGSDPDQIRQAAAAGITRWRNRAADPFADPVTREVCEAGAHTCEVFLAAAG